MSNKNNYLVHLIAVKHDLGSQMQVTADVGELKWLTDWIALELISNIPIIGILNQGAKVVPTLSTSQDFTSDALCNHHRRRTLVESELSISGRGNNGLSRGSPLA